MADVSILCTRGGGEHRHTSLIDSKICWGIIRRPVPPVPAVHVRRPLDLATPRQLNYIERLGGDRDYAKSLPCQGPGSASEYIEKLQKGQVPTVTAPSVPADRPPAITKRQRMMIDLLTGIPNGYFAVQKEEGAHVDFLRVSRPTGGNWKGCTKVQTQHSEVLRDGWVYKPATDKLFTFRNIEEQLMLLLPDWQGAAMRYARLIGKCCRCNLALTDDRSRWYGIGPDCEQVWPDIISLIEEQKGPFRGRH